MNDNWKYVLNKLESETGIDFRASIDNTGNLAVGGNWILESDNVNIKDIYFTEAIESWYHILDNTLRLFNAIIDTSGRLYTTGSNSSKQLGIGSVDSSRNIFTLVSSISNEFVVQVSCGNTHAGCVTSSGKLYMWGSNSSGRTGLASTVTEPTLVSDISNIKIVQVSCGNSHTLCLDSSGNIYATGSNGFGQVGQVSTVTANNTFIIISGLNKKFIQVESGSFHSAAITDNGDIYTWGQNLYGQLGLNSTTQVNYPTRVTLGGISNEIVKHVSCSVDTTACATDSSKCYIWGNGSTYGMYGDGEGDNKNFTLLIPYLYGKNSTETFPNVKEVTLGGQTTYIINQNNQLYMSGLNRNNWGGYIKSTATTSVFNPNRIDNILKINNIKQVSSFLNSTSYSSAYQSTFFLDNSGNLYAIGENSNGQLGLGNFNDSPIATTGSGFYDLSKINVPSILTLARDATNYINSISYNNNNIDITQGNSYISNTPTISMNASAYNPFIYFSLINAPTGITIDNTGVIRVSNSVTANVYIMTVRATTNNIDYITTTFTVNVNDGSLTTFRYDISSSSVSFGISGSSVEPTVNATGATVTYDISSGGTTGISIDGSGIIVWSTTVAVGTYNLTLKANNTVNTLTTTYTLTVNPVPITSLIYDASMVSINYGNTYTSNLPTTVNGSNYNRVYSLVSAPTGVTIDNSGRFTVPSTLIPATYNFAIRVTNDNINFASFSFRITVNLVPLTSINYSVTTVDISYGNTYTSAVPSSFVGSNYNVVYSLSGEPNGVTIDNSGRINVADYLLIKDGYSFTVKATNNNINFALRTFIINIRYIGFAYYNNNNPPRLINTNDSNSFYRGVIGIPSSSGTPVYTITPSGTPVYKIKQILG
jgi:alpha-tubulin suppressor-like RCC1 family protein